MTEERRRAKRYVLWIPVQVTSGPEARMLAVSRNVSWSGVLVIAAAHLEVGAKVTLSLSMPDEDERTVEGEIVRVEPNEEDPDGLWRHRLAVRFDAPQPELEEAFDRLESKGSALV